MKKGTSVFAIVLGLLVAATFLRYGTVSPCGALKKQVKSQLMSSAITDISDNPWESAGQGLGLALAGPMIDNMVDSLAPMQCVMALYRLEVDGNNVFSDQFGGTGSEYGGSAYSAPGKKPETPEWQEHTEKQRAKIRTLLAEAKQLRKDKKLHGAAEKYEQVLTLDSEMVEAKKGLRDTKDEIKAFEEKQAYIKNVPLYDLEARYYKTYLDKKVPGVEFKLKNKGKRTLKEVQVTVYFKDKSGTVIAEEKYHPVLVSSYSLVGDKKLLKPNYIWQLERDKFYKADSVPSEWKEGAVSAKVTGIEFAN